MKENIRVVVIVPNFDYLQIYTHGCYYTRPTKMIDGESYFKFLGKWHRTADYVDEHTTINNIGSDFK